MRGSIDERMYHYPEDLPKVIVITLDDDTILHIHRGLHPGDDPYLCRPTEPTHVAFVRIKMLTVSGIRCKHLELFNMWLRKANQLEEIVIEGTGGGEYHYFLDIADELSRCPKLKKMSINLIHERKRDICRSTLYRLILMIATGGILEELELICFDFPCWTMKAEKTTMDLSKSTLKVLKIEDCEMIQKRINSRGERDKPTFIANLVHRILAVSNDMERVTVRNTSIESELFWATFSHLVYCSSMTHMKFYRCNIECEVGAWVLLRCMLKRGTLLKEVIIHPRVVNDMEERNTVLVRMQEISKIIGSPVPLGHYDRSDVPSFELDMNGWPPLEVLSRFKPDIYYLLSDILDLVRCNCSLVSMYMRLKHPHHPVLMSDPTLVNQIIEEIRINASGGDELTLKRQRIYGAKTVHKSNVTTITPVPKSIPRTDGVDEIKRSVVICSECGVRKKRKLNKSN